METYRAALRESLDRFGPGYDYIFLDAQAGADAYAEVAVSPEVSDEVVIVTEYDPVSAAGVERLKAIFGDSLAYPRTWILLNKMLPDFVSSFSEFLEIARYLSPVPWDAQVVRAYARRTLALDTERGNDHTLAVLNTLRGMLGDELGEDLDRWLDSRAEAIQAPIRDQLAETRDELDAVTGRQHQLKEASRRRGRRANILLWGSLVVAGIGANLAAGVLPGSPALRVLVLSSAGVLATGALTMWATVRRPADGVEADRLSVQRDLLVDRLRRLSVLEEMRAESLLGDRSDRVPARDLGRGW